MEKISLNNLELVVFDKNNSEHLKFLKSLIKDKTIRARFQGLTNNLIHNFGDEFFGRSFYVATKDNKLIGFVNIGNFNEYEKCVYLRAAIDMNSRCNGYGNTLLSEITAYIFDTYPSVETIRLKIASDNKAGIYNANACGYIWYKDDYYIAYNPSLESDYIPPFK